MATITPSYTNLTYRGLFVWSGVVAGDTCDAVEVSAATWRSVSWAGTFAGSGASIRFEESNDGTNWSTLVTWPPANRCENLEGRARYVRPNIANLGMGDSVNFFLLFSQQP